MIHISEVNVEIKGRTIPLRRVKLICEDESLTKQAFTKAADIRTIIANSIKAGGLPAPTKAPIFGDFTNSGDYLTKLNQVAHFKSQFQALPPKTRERFANDPANLLDFLADESNNEEAIKLGLKDAPKPVVTEEPKIPVVPPTTTPAS